MHQRLAQSGELGDLLSSRVRGRDEVDERRRGGGRVVVLRVSGGGGDGVVVGLRAVTAGRAATGAVDGRLSLPAAAAKRVLRNTKRCLLAMGLRPKPTDTVFRRPKKNPVRAPPLHGRRGHEKIRSTSG